MYDGIPELVEHKQLAALCDEGVTSVPLVAKSGYMTIYFEHNMADSPIDSAASFANSEFD